MEKGKLKVHKETKLAMSSVEKPHKDPPIK